MLTARRDDYRADIDGLRAISVLAVVLYHYGFSALPGGFLGVDVFFVISGYLITSLLYRDIKSGSFSLLSFYDRRVRRILPAFLVVLIASIVAGYFILIPGDYEALGEQAAYSALGIANFYFLNNTGYFDQAADMLPLLHMWSLAVEEQFYLVWPLLLAKAAYLSRKSTKAIGALLVAMISVSLAYAEYAVRTEPDVAFYMLPSRSWELAIGALMVFLPPLKNRILAEGAATAGLGAILLGMLTISAADPFPGFAALYPCAGAALVIWPKSGHTAVARMLSLKPAVFIGLLSYSLYLWHWPVLVFFRHYKNGDVPSHTEAAALIAVSLLLSWLSWRFVEKPMGRRRDPRLVVSAGALSVIAASCLGATIVIAEGFVSRLPANAHALSSFQEMWKWTCPQNIHIEGLEGNLYCVVGATWETAERKALVWGDSNAVHLAPLLDVVGKENGIAMAIWHACPPFIDNQLVRRVYSKHPDYSEKCSRSRREALDWIRREQPDIVAMSASWAGVSGTLYSSDPTVRSSPLGLQLMKSGLKKTIGEIDASRHELILLADIPYFKRDPNPCAVTKVSGLLREGCRDKDLFMTAADMYSRHAATNRVLRMAAEETGARFLPINVNMCRGGRCVSEVDGEFLYRDRNHILLNLSDHTRRKLIQIMGLDEVGRQPPISSERRTHAARFAPSAP
ncbi:acyltransferase family protein [Mesorhizobium sp. WSM2239]|uniref:Acyltransferase family protein n=2 Tax=unclassified Mesorhizobium TaxID=325217 RepID=A0AAU8D3L8_9HYPH